MKNKVKLRLGLFLIIILIVNCLGCSATSQQAIGITDDLSVSAEHDWTSTNSSLTISPAVTGGTTTPSNEQPTVTITPSGATKPTTDSKLTVTPTISPETTVAVSLTPEPTEEPVPTKEAVEPTKAAEPTNTASEETDSTSSPDVTKAPVSDSEGDEVPTFSGSSYVIIDPDTNEVKLSYNEDKRIYPASTIKLLTALVALDQMDMNDTITAEQKVLDVCEWDAVQYGIVAGAKYPLRVWMHLLLISSFGDAADVIAHEAGGTIKKFVALMNEKAQELGMNDTLVDNAIGLDIGNEYYEMYSTASDIAKLAVVAMNNAAIREIVAKETYTVPACSVMESRVIESTNWYFTKSETYNSEYFKAIGTKSGMTDASGYCYVATVVNDEGQKYICAYFGAATKDTVFREMTALLEYTYINLTD